MDEASLFRAALAAPALERAALLERECAGDPELRARIEARLADARASSAKDAGATRSSKGPHRSMVRASAWSTVRR